MELINRERFRSLSPAAWKRPFTFLGSLRARLIALVMLAMLPVFGLILFSTTHQIEERKGQVKENLVQLARLVAASQEQSYEGARQLLISLSLSPPVRDGNAENCSIYLSNLIPQYPVYALLAVADMNGSITCSSQPLKSPINVADRTYFRRAIQTNRFTVGDYQIERVTNRPSLGLAYPVYTQSGKTKGVVFATLDLTSYAQLGHRFDLQLQSRTTLLVTDQRGTVLLHFPGPDVWEGRSIASSGAFYKLAGGDVEGSFEAACLDTDQPCLFAFRQIVPAPGAGYIIMQVQTRHAFEPVYQTTQIQIIILLIVSVLALAAAWFGGDFFLLRAIRGLTLAANQIASGNLSTRTGLHYGSSELGKLAATFDLMAVSLQQAEEARSTSEQRLANILQNGSEAIVSLNDQLQIIVFNKGAEQTFGYKSEQVIGSPLTILMPDPPGRDQDLFFEMLARLVERPNGHSPERYEFFWRNSQGRLFPAEASMSWMKANGGKIYTIFLSDITQRLKTTEELRESRRALSTLLSNLPGMAYRARDHAGRWAVEFASEGAYELCGYTPDELSIEQPEIYFRIIHPDDTARVDREIQQAIELRQPYRTIYRIRTKHGKEKWVWEQGRLVSSPGAGEPVLEGLITDITERREVEHKVEQQNTRLKTLRIMDMAITELLDLQSILNTLVEQIHTQMQADAVMVLLFTPTRRLEYAAGIGFRSTKVLNFQCALGIGLIGQAALIRRQLSCSEIRTAEDAPSISESFKDEGFIDCIASPLVSKNELKGMLVIFHRSEFAINAEWSEFLAALSDQAAIAIDNATLYEQSRRSNTELMLAYEETIEGWASALELRDQETEGHSRRVVGLTISLARAMGMPEEELIHIRRGAILHDIGKMGVPDSILQKPGPLSADEWEKMRLHPIYAFRLLSTIPFLRPALDIPFSHHERWDGSGYPRGLRGNEIPIAARIFAVIDVWDALRSRRPYRGALPDDEVKRYLQAQAGKEFDPKVVECFLALLKNERAGAE